MNNGSLLSLNVSDRCGLSRNAFQIRPTVDRDSPELFAIDARDQCVAFTGVFSKVSTTTCSTCSSVIFRGTPGRGSPPKPLNRAQTTPDRHLPTIGRNTPHRATTAVLDNPSAHTNKIR